MNFNKIDLDNWKRKEIFNHYLNREFDTWTLENCP
ncbi:chloramphenicol O-acetyltransferase [Streptococcus pyogenes]|nr:chloramphenicol O-acetyltransferase [Streptococcus pyogenes]